MFILKLIIPPNSGSYFAATQFFRSDTQNVSHRKWRVLMIQINKKVAYYADQMVWLIYLISN